MKDIADCIINEDSLGLKLKQAVEKFEADTMLQSVSNNKDIKGDRVKLFLTPQADINFSLMNTKNNDNDNIIYDLVSPAKKFKSNDNTKWLTIKGLGNNQGMISYIN